MPTNDKPASNRMERKKEETKNRIIAVAIKLFNGQGVDATTMEHIAEEVDIAKGTLYNYFPVKEAIIAEFIEQAFETENPRTMLELEKMPDTRTRMLNMMRMMIEGVRQYKGIFEKFMVYRMQRTISIDADKEGKGGFGQLAETIVTLGQKQGEVRKDLPMGLLTNLFDFVFTEIVKQFYLEPDKFENGEVIEQCVELFLNGVKYEDKYENR